MSEWSRRESPDERIEIELTPVAARPPSARSVDVDSLSITGDPAGDSLHEWPRNPPDQGDPSPASAQRRTLLITGVAVGVLALAIGWVVGRSESADNATVDETPTPTSMEVATTERITDTIAPPPTTARPRPSTTTTTTLPPGTPVDILLPPELRALPYELAVSTYDGELHRIDLTAGILRTYRGSRDGESYLAFSRDGDLLVYAPWSLSSVRTLALDGSQTSLVSAAAGGSQYAQVVVDGVGDVWVVQPDDTAATISTGDAPNEVLQLPPGVTQQGGAFGDPAGGLLANASSDVFDINESGSTRITTGEIVALGADTAIVNECDEALVCGHFVIDRTTGGRQPYPLEEVVQGAASELGQVNPGARVIVHGGGYWPIHTTAARNTAVIGVSVTDGNVFFSEGLVILDLAQQRVVGVLPFTYGPVALSDDGLWVFANANGAGLVAFEVPTGNTYGFGPNLNEGLNSIVLRNRFQA